MAKIERLVEKLTQSLGEKFGDRVEEVILFGSFARGESRKNMQTC